MELCGVKYGAYKSVFWASFAVIGGQITYVGSTVAITIYTFKYIAKIKFNVFSTSILAIIFKSIKSVLCPTEHCTVASS